MNRHCSIERNSILQFLSKTVFVSIDVIAKVRVSQIAFQKMFDKNIRCVSLVFRALTRKEYIVYPFSKTFEETRSTDVLFHFQEEKSFRSNPVLRHAQYGKYYCEKGMNLYSAICIPKEHYNSKTKACIQALPRSIYMYSQ